jgi:hypothetical protein
LLKFSPNNSQNKKINQFYEVRSRHRTQQGRFGNTLLKFSTNNSKLMRGFWGQLKSDHIFKKIPRSLTSLVVKKLGIYAKISFCFGFTLLTINYFGKKNSQIECFVRVFNRQFLKNN